jgi:hypothetical protein
MNTLFLNPGPWDLTLDASGNIALAAEPYSLAQDAASAIEAKDFAAVVAGFPNYEADAVKLFNDIAALGAASAEKIVSAAQPALPATAA